MWFWIWMMLVWWEYVPVTNTTKINIWFDSSWSMNSTLVPLEIMQSTILKTRLLPFYNNDWALYDSLVTVQSFSTERSFQIINTLNGSNPIIHFVFQDESTPYWAETTYPTNITATYNTDMPALRWTINWVPTNLYRSTVFQVNTWPWDYPWYKLFLQAVKNWTWNYSWTNWLSDKWWQFTVSYDVTEWWTPTYYADLICAELWI